MKSIFDIETESGLATALETYCDKNGLPFACANELLADCHGHVAWLSEFIRQWEKVQGANDKIMQTMLGQGFEREIGGGGCVVLSRYFESGAFVWATCLDGGGLPESDNWHVVAYGDDIDDIIASARSDDERDVTLEQATLEALHFAREFESEYALCRNGKPMADCDCC